MVLLLFQFFFRPTTTKSEKEKRDAFFGSSVNGYHEDLSFEFCLYHLTINNVSSVLEVENIIDKIFPKPVKVGNVQYTVMSGCSPVGSI